MNFGRDIEHGGFPTSETRTISTKRREANLYAGIGTKKGWRQTQKSVDTVSVVEVTSQGTPPLAAPETTSTRSRPMILQFKSLSRNGKNAFYTGAAVAIRVPLSAFPNKTQPDQIEVADGVFAPAKAAKVKMTAEERKAARAAKPKPTLAEKAAKAKERADKLAAELAAANEGDQGGDPQL